MSTPQAAQPSPALFFQTVNAYQMTECLKAAVTLDVFTAIAEGNSSPGQIAERCSAAERGVDALCHALVTMGFLTKNGDGFGLTPDSKVFLDSRKPSYVGHAIEFLLSPTLTFGFEKLADAVRAGGSVIGEAGTVSKEHPVWQTFARAMPPLTVLSREWIAALAAEDGNVARVLDIAAGHGMYGIEVAQQIPGCRVVALDWNPVLKAARHNAEVCGVADRWEAIEGDAFEVEFGGKYDVVLVTNFLHHFDPGSCEAFLKKVRSSLAEGGRAITLEFVPNEDRVSPPEQAMFNMIMLATTPWGKAYTFSELDSMLRTAGFAHNELHELEGVPQRVIVSSL